MRVATGTENDDATVDVAAASARLLSRQHSKLFFMQNQRIFMIPGSEPILLDLEKLFLLSDSMENLNFYRKFEISEPEKNRKNPEISY